MSAAEIIGFISGPSFTLATVDDDRPTRWCFQCRAHLPHSWALIDEPPERQPSYYDPVPVIRCLRCQEDHTVHPGSYRDGPACPPEGVWMALVKGAIATRATDSYALPYEAAMERWRKDAA